MVKPRGCSTRGAVEGEEVVEGNHKYSPHLLFNISPPTQPPAKENGLLLIVRLKVQVLFLPFGTTYVEQFLTSLRYEQRGKLDQLGIEIGTFD
jgi:hypothetical protein